MTKQKTINDELPIIELVMCHNDEFIKLHIKALRSLKKVIDDGNDDIQLKVILNETKLKLYNILIDSSNYYHPYLDVIKRHLSEILEDKSHINQYKNKETPHV